MEKCTVGQDTDDNMAHAHWMLDTYGYKYTHRMCNNHCFYTATAVAHTRIDDTLQVYCLSYSFTFSSTFEMTAYVGEYQRGQK